MSDFTQKPDFEKLKVFHRLLVEHFSLDELRTLCLYLGVNHEDLGGGGISAQARNLIGLMGRNDRFVDLLEGVKKERPNLTWPDIANVKLPSSWEQTLDNVVISQVQAENIAGHDVIKAERDVNIYHGSSEVQEAVVQPTKQEYETSEASVSIQLVGCFVAWIKLVISVTSTALIVYLVVTVFLMLVIPGYKDIVISSVLRLSSMRSTSATYIPEDEVSALAFSPDGNKVAVGAEDTLRLWEIPSGTLLHTFGESKEDLWAIAFSPDGSILASGSIKGNVQLYRLSDWQLIQTIIASPNPTQMLADWVFKIAFSPDGKTLATGTGDGIRLWKVSDGTLLQTLQHPDTSQIRDVAFSPDGKILATEGLRDVRLWRVVDGELLSVLSQSDYVDGVDFSSEGQILAIGLKNGTVKLWDVVNEEEIQTLEGHTDEIVDDGVAFSPDGRILATASQDGTILLWKIPEGVLERKIEIECEPGVFVCWPRRLAYSPDGERIAAEVDGQIYFWKVP